MQTLITRTWLQQNVGQTVWPAMLRRLWRCGTIAALAIIALSARAFESPSTPDRALAAFQCDPGLHVELVAAEPLVFQPCAVAWDAEGHLFVAENRGYPTGPGPGEPPAGVIARLDDTDGDGRMDRRTVFADGLTFPNGLTPWKGGLIVTCAPDHQRVDPRGQDHVAGTSRTRRGRDRHRLPLQSVHA
jgi:glucose/arabinose dehydrogenase